MRTFRNRLRQAVLAALPAAAVACSGGGNVVAPSTATAGSGTSGAGTTGGSGSTSTGGTTGANFCAGCEAQGLVCDIQDNLCVTECSLCGGCIDIVASVDALDGGFDDGGLPLEICLQACPDPDGTGVPGGTVGWNVLACQAADCPDSWSDGGGTGPLCVDCTVQNCNGAGRAPEGLQAAPRGSAGSSAVGDYLARCSHLEASSAIAFERMAAELQQLGAPARLVARARGARADELRHAAVTRGLAERWGGAVPSPSVAPWPPRGLEAFAAENAREGCVRETFGAAVAAWQAASVRDPQLRGALAEIARDEARHAELSWAVARWAEGRLPADARERLARLRRETARALQAEALAPRERSLVELGLLPDAPTAERLLAEVHQALWQD